MSAHINNKIFCDSANALIEVLNIVAVDKNLAKQLAVPNENAEVICTLTSSGLSKVANKYVKSLASTDSIFRINRDVLCEEIGGLNGGPVAYEQPFNNIQKNKLRSISVISITSLVGTILEESEEGGSKIIKLFEFSQSEVYQLENLQRHQIQQLAEQYIYSVGLYDLFRIEPKLLSNCIESVLKDIKEKELIESYIEHKACNKTLISLFGLRSSHIADFRKKLNCPVSIGRSFDVKEENDNKIFQRWNRLISVADERERYLKVAIDLNIGVSEVFRNIQMFEIANLKHHKIA